MTSLTCPSANAQLTDWLDYLLAIHPTEIDMGLTRVRQVAQNMGLISAGQSALGAAKVITVAGTNGKGTTCAYLEKILTLAGKRVGVYSSPHMIKYNERVRIEGVDASDSDFIAAFEAIEKARAEISLTFFEYATLAGLMLFKAARLDVIILEVGLGGRLDATNIIDADVSVVTSVDLDHESYLGNTRELVGREKAGVFRAGKPAIVGEPDRPQSVDDVGQSIGACLYRVGDEFSYELMPPATGLTEVAAWQYQGKLLKLNNLPLPSLPLPNAATAIAVIEQGFADVLAAMSEKDIAELIGRGISEATLTGRFECVSHAPLVLLDVAHNPHAARYLAKQLERYQGKRIIALCGMLKDKDIKGVLSVLTEVIDLWALVSLSGERGASSAQLKSALPSHAKADTFDTLQTAWESVKAQITADDVVIVFGSFYTVAGFKTLLDRK